MKANRSLSLLKVNKELNQRVLGKLFYRDPCFTNMIEDKLSDQYFQIRNLYKRRLPTLFLNDNVDQRKTEAMLISGSHTLRHINCKKEISIKHMFDIHIKKKEYFQAYKTKFNEFNSNQRLISIGSPVLSQSSRKRTSNSYSCSSVISSLQINIKDDFNSHVNNSINLIDKKYKMKLGLLKPIPLISIYLKNKNSKTSMITNEYIKSKLYLS